MRLHIERFEPSGKAGTFTLTVPAGAVPLVARRTRMGDGNLVLSVGDAKGETETVELLSLWEDSVRGEVPGEPGEWRHLGCWSFDSGDFQHLFVRMKPAAESEQPQPSAGKRRRRGAAETEQSAVEAGAEDAAG